MGNGEPAIMSHMAVVTTGSCEAAEPGSMPGRPGPPSAYHQQLRSRETCSTPRKVIAVTAPNAAPVDRAAAVRHALRRLVARNGFHGTSMNAVAKEAGVATGTAYTHYSSKDELVLASYQETKAELSAAATAGLPRTASGAKDFHRLWAQSYRHLEANPEHAQFLLQVDNSPYRDAAHQATVAAGDPLLDLVASPAIASQLLPLPLEVLYELGLGVTVRLTAAGIRLTAEQLDDAAAACWRAIRRPVD